MFNFSDVYIQSWLWWTMIGVIVFGVVVVVVLLHIRHRRVAKSTQIGSNSTATMSSNMDIVDNINKIKVAFGARDIVFGAIALSISFVLWIFPVFRLPFGAHVTLASPLPMLLYGYFFGLKKALVVALGHMLLTLMYFPYIVSPWSAVLDYVVPSLSMAAAGLVDFRPKGDKLTGLRTHNKFYIGLMICFVVRLASHTWAGIVFWSKDIDFAIWSGDLVGFDALMYSLVYNLAYLVPETILVIVASVMVFNSSQLVKTIVR